MFLTIIISLICVWLAYVLVCRHYLPPVNELVPTCPGKLPLIGHSYLLIKIETMFQSMISFGEYSLKVGNVTKIFMWPMPIYVVTDPEDVSTVLNKCLEKMFVYRFVEPMLGKMLVAAEVPTWKRNRRILDLCFKQHLLDDYLKLFNDQAGRFAELLADEVDKGVVDLTEMITRSVLETACRRKFQSVLDVLLENTVTLTSSLFRDVELRNIADNLLLATFDTTIYEMLFVFVCIGSYPEVQEKVYEEITQVLGDDGTVSKEHLSRLVYLEAVIKESIRLYPIAPIVGREATTDTRLRDVTIPAGSSILVHVWSINRNTKYWGLDAEEFKPERWLSSVTVPAHQAAYASFSPGRRGCIGKTYALMYLKATMIPVIRKYKLTADHTKMKLECKVMIKPKSGHLVNIEKRQFNK